MAGADRKSEFDRSRRLFLIRDIKHTGARRTLMQASSSCRDENDEIPDHSLHQEHISTEPCQLLSVRMIIGAWFRLGSSMMKALDMYELPHSVNYSSLPRFVRTPRHSSPLAG